MTAWRAKPLLRAVYRKFYTEILSFIPEKNNGLLVELGSGVGGFKEICPQCITTDLFPNPWIDRVENVYGLSFDSGSVSCLVMFDVFHHIEFPGNGLDECARVLEPGGKVIIFEPYISLLGFIVYGIFHKEPIALFKKIRWHSNKTDNHDVYYAAQGNATRIFRKHSTFQNSISANWEIIEKKKFSALSYILSGGFSKPALYPAVLLPAMLIIEKFFDVFPLLFATRILIVLKKK